MKLYATIKNERGGKKSTGDDTRILLELTYKNKIVGEIGLYSIRDSGEDLGYRVVWNSDNTQQVIKEEEKIKVKKQKDTTKDCICIDNVLNKHCKATLHDW